MGLRGEKESSQVCGWLKYHYYVICSILLIEKSKSITPSYLCILKWGRLQYLRWDCYSSFSGFQLPSLRFIILKCFSSIFSQSFQLSRQLAQDFFPSATCHTAALCYYLCPSLFLSLLRPATELTHASHSLLSHLHLSPLTSPLSNPQTAAPPFLYTNITFSLAPIRRSLLSGQLLI